VAAKSGNLALFDSRFSITTENLSLSDSKTFEYLENLSLHNSHFIPTSKNQSILDCAGKLDYKNLSLSDARFTAQSKSLSLFDSRWVGTFALNHSLLDSRIEGTTSKNLSKLSSFYTAGYNIYALDIATGTEALLGFLDASGALVLTDEALADGTYELTCRSVSLFWDNCRDGKKLTVTISGGVITSQGLPRILNLRREFSRFTPYLKWTIEDEYTLEDISFAIWLSNSTPVSTVGTPDYTCQYWAGQADYTYKYTQSASKYILVAARTTTTIGPTTEIYCAWDSTSPTSPSNQLGRDEEDV
jgi:hypothetical protein